MSETKKKQGMPKLQTRNEIQYFKLNQRLLREEDEQNVPLEIFGTNGSCYKRKNVCNCKSTQNRKGTKSQNRGNIPQYVQPHI